MSSVVFRFVVTGISQLRKAVQIHATERVKVYKIRSRMLKLRLTSTNLKVCLYFEYVVPAERI